MSEAFLLVSFLQRLVPDLNSSFFGMIHLSVLVLFAALIGYFNVAVSLRARRRAGQR